MRRRNIYRPISAFQLTRASLRILLSHAHSKATFSHCPLLVSACVRARLMESRRKRQYATCIAYLLFIRVTTVTIGHYRPFSLYAVTDRLRVLETSVLVLKLRIMFDNTSDFTA